MFMKNEFGFAHIVFLLLGGILLTAILVSTFIISFTASQPPKLNVTPQFESERVTNLKRQLSSGGLAAADEPTDVEIELKGEEFTALLLEIRPADAPFENPQVQFANGKILVSVEVLEPVKGSLYFEGKIIKVSETEAKVEFLTAQFNNVVLKSASLKFAESKVNDYINSQLALLSGVKINRLEIVDDTFYFSGNFPDLWDGKGGSNFVAGEILVGIKEGVSEEEFEKMIRSYGLRWESNYQQSFSYWVKLKTGDPEVLAQELEKSALVGWADRRGYGQGEKGFEHLLVQFNEGVKDEQAHELIGGFKELEIASDRSGLKYNWAKVFVPKGEEKKWIDTLEDESIVRYAEVNLILGL